MPDNREWFKTLAGHEIKGYVLQEYVGCGLIGYVYKAVHREYPGDWAVKITPGNPRPGWDNELKKVTQLSTIHGVVHFHHADTGQIKKDTRTEVFQFSVWDYIAPGRNLKQYLQTATSVPASFLMAVVDKILSVLHACRARGVPRHGDLHAGNILVGDEDPADLDPLTLKPRAPVYVSDFGYGTTGGQTQPKDDYIGLAQIVSAIVDIVDWDAGTAVDRHQIQNVIPVLLKLLREGDESQRRPPLDILEMIRESSRQQKQAAQEPPIAPQLDDLSDGTHASVGHFLVSEMLGEAWYWWRKLFVSTVPGRSRILEPGLPAVVTGPRGCGKTMLFRRLSSRVVVECGEVSLNAVTPFAALYVNANDFADAFAAYPASPSAADTASLICYANICVLSDFMAVIAARQVKLEEVPSTQLLTSLEALLMPAEPPAPVIALENVVDRLRYVLERIKWSFPLKQADSFPGYEELGRHNWLPRFIREVRPLCAWLGKLPLLLFVDDFTTPRVSANMQRTLNRVFFQRSSEFVCKVATESATTFIAEDVSGKALQDGDDYQMIDIGEESLFMHDAERAAFLDDVFARRLQPDPRVPNAAASLSGILGKSRWSKTEFARLLRREDQSAEDQPGTMRRGATRTKVLYQGRETFHSLWSGDTRMMIQLVQELLDSATVQSPVLNDVPIGDELQDRVFRDRGSQWLESHSRSQPTDRDGVDVEMASLQKATGGFSFEGGTYGTHLKAIVEAFVYAARRLLLEAPVYVMREGARERHVPRMAFRIEVVDEFRLDGLARYLYSDLIRYGLFLRDPRGKSVRGAMVPRLYLRRLLLPFATLALSKRDSVQMTCGEFQKLLLTPDLFRADFDELAKKNWRLDPNQTILPFGEVASGLAAPAREYDDLADEELD
jgi:hypothetical protein